ncbi:MAG: GvpL/GvpF family gas vesicle protein [Pseudomonadota bacterium]
MAVQASNKKGRYLYAVIYGSEERIYGSCGIDDSIVYTIFREEVAAVVSDVPNGKLRPERRHLAAHQAVLKRLMEESTPLPMSFGIIADGPETIKKILTDNQPEFVEQLDRVSGKVEMGLRVTWDVPNIFEYFVSTHPELRAARDRYFGTHREPTQDDKIELGRMFDRMLNEDRESYADDVENVLLHCCFEITRNKCRTEREVLNLACLVGRDAEARFEEGILEAANLFDNNFAFDYNGPWAPHNFVDMELKL